MKKDAAIEDFFAHYRPDLGNSDQYLERLSKKLEAMEYAKQYREAQTRRYRRMMVAVFVSGIITGVVGIVVLLLHPLWLFPAYDTLNSVTVGSFAWIPNILFLLGVCLASLVVTRLVLSLQRCFACPNVLPAKFGQQYDLAYSENDCRKAPYPK